MKLKGLKSLYNSYNFEEIPLKEQRILKLKNISGEKIISGLKKRKFLYYSDFEQKKIIFELLITSIKNVENVKKLKNYDIIDMMIKSGYKHDIIREDIEPIFNKTLKSIMKNIGIF